jgi:hypothetical protein
MRAERAAAGLLQAARAQLQAVMQVQGELLEALVAERVHVSVAAIYFARVTGIEVTSENRLRIAARLRKRLQRARRTVGHDRDGFAPGAVDERAQPSPSRLTSEPGKESPMGKLVKKKVTTTETWVRGDDDDLDPAADLDDEMEADEDETDSDGDEDDGDEEVAERTSARASASKRSGRRSKR